MEKITRIQSFIKLKTINWISLIFSTTLLFFSIQTYNIFPKITSDTPQLQKRNLEEKITENCLSAITSIEFIDYSNLTINYSEYKYLAIYRPFHKYEHKKRLSNGSYTYIYTNNSFEEGYESRKITDQNKKLYFYNNKIVKVKTTKFLINEHYNSTNHTCIDGYKSCGKVSNKNFTVICVPKDDECPIENFQYSSSEIYTGFENQNYKTIKFRDNRYFHYTQYDENKTITNLYLDFGIYCGFGKNDFLLALFEPTSYYKYTTDLEFSQFKSQNNIVEVYPQYYYYTLYLTIYVKNMDYISYSNMKCISDVYEPNKSNSTDSNNTKNNSTDNNDTKNNNTNTNNTNNNNNSNNENSYNNIMSNNNNNNIPNNNQNTNPSIINYGNYDKDPSFIYNNSSLVDFRNKMKDKFETALILSVIFNLICIIFIVFEILIMKKLDYEDDTKIFFHFLILRLIHFILNLIILIYEIYLLTKYNFNIERILFIKFSKLIHTIYIILCLIILSLDVLSFYYLLTLFNSFRKLKKEYLEVKKDSTITQNESSNYENKNSTDLKIRNNDSNNIVPSPAQFNQVPTTVINMNPYNN